ncbi:MAG: ParA family protein [Thermofilum sp.]|nr:ParA family protein [Thermofilum sp.]
MKVVTFLSVKGGVGKTTLTVNTANELASRVGGEEKVLVIDLDAQAGATVYVLGHKQQENLEKRGSTAYELLRSALRAGEEALDPERFVVEAGGEWSSRLYLLPGDSRIMAIEREAIAEAAAGGFGWIVLLRQLLPKLSESGFSYVFIDPPAAFGALARMALAAADYFVVPIVPDDLGRVSFRMFVSDFFREAVLQIKQSGRSEPPLCGGVVFNKIKSKTQEVIANSIAEEVSTRKLYGRYAIPVYKSRLHDYIIYVKALEEHKPLSRMRSRTDQDEQAKEEFESYYNDFYDYVVRDKVKSLG